LSQLRYDLSERVRKQDLFGFLEIGPDVGKLQHDTAPLERDASRDDPEGAAGSADERSLRYQSNSATYDAFQIWAQGVLDKEVQRQRFETAHVDLSQDKLTALLRPVHLIAKGLSSLDPNGAI